MQDCSLYLAKANLMQKICERGPQSSEIFGRNFNEQMNLSFGQIRSSQYPRGNTAIHRCKKAVSWRNDSGVTWLD